MLKMPSLKARACRSARPAGRQPPGPQDLCGWSRGPTPWAPPCSGPAALHTMWPPPLPELPESPGPEAMRRAPGHPKASLLGLQLALCQAAAAQARTAPPGTSTLVLQSRACLGVPILPAHWRFPDSGITPAGDCWLLHSYPCRPPKFYFYT